MNTTTFGNIEIVGFGVDFCFQNKISCICFFCKFFLIDPEYFALFLGTHNGSKILLTGRHFLKPLFGSQGTLKWIFPLKTQHQLFKITILSLHVVED